VTLLSRTTLRGLAALHLLLLAPAFGLQGCGGKQELNFVGATGGTSSGGKGNMVSATCGDRVVDTDEGEECDDGDRADEDGCSGTCTVEDGWTCSGEPSACVACGNETVEGEEECDDGNSDDGDGCNSECKVEGSCSAPTPIELSAEGDGLVGSETARTGADEASQVEAAECGDDDAGDGADRVFEFVLPGPADLVVSVGANFDAIVRLTTEPCDLASELPDTCANEGAVGDEETAVVNNAPAGTYYVIVDGETAQQAGDFSVTVEARCPLDGLKIHKVTTGEPFRTTILNTNDCAIDLSRVGIYAQPEAADSPKTLPAITLDPHTSRLLTSESPPPAGTTYQGNIRYDLEDYAGAFYLCRGECDSASGSNVVDAFRWRGASNPTIPPLADVTFDANGPALGDRTTMSYYRVAYDGVAPDFVAADYLAAYLVETFEDHGLPTWEAPEDLFYEPAFVALDGTIGGFSYELKGGDDSWNGTKYDFVNNLGVVTPIPPTYVSYQVRGSDKTIDHGAVFFGRMGAEDAAFGSFFRSNGSLGFDGATLSIFVQYQVETWNLIEYSNIDWVAKTADITVNGMDRGTLTLAAATNMSQVNVRNPGEATSWIDHLVVQ
jgi:cysteine-rich repeat protein